MSIPASILAACAGLFLLFAFFLVRMLSEGARARRSFQALENMLREVESGGDSVRRHGLTASVLNQLREKADSLGEPMRGWWRRIEHNLLSFCEIDGSEEWYLAMPARELLPEDSVSEREYHASFHDSVPGILTGLGLMCTFIAILVALTGLRVTVINDTETMVGIQKLIEGLAGKFLTSIIGLMLSMVFLMVERKWCERRVSHAYEEMVDAVSRLIPVMNAARAQVEMQRLSARQTAALETIQADIAALGRVVSARNDDVPRMAGALAADVEHFADKLQHLESALDRGIRQLLQ